MGREVFPHLYYSITDKYPQTITDDGWSMDERHVMILFNLLQAYPYKKVLEIGSHYGYSTTAFLEAIMNGCNFEVHLCDQCFKGSILDLCGRFNNVFTHQMRSEIYLANSTRFDFVLLDGSHISEDVEDEFEYLSLYGTTSILLHDTCTQNLPENKNTPWYDGPLLLKNKLLSSQDWLCIEDNKKRDGEMTERGLFFATKSPYIYSKSIEVFSYWSKAIITCVKR